MPPVNPQSNVAQPQQQEPVITPQTAESTFNSLAIIGFLLSFFSTFIGLAISIIALKQISQNHQRGRSLAIAGIIISSVIIVLVIVVVILIELTVGKTF